ncbi:hypothetical protein N9C70_05135, partial [Flavobacteriales bacterium]|nr:hypothetical protein [Flavobacteriales bacterium]
MDECAASPILASDATAGGTELCGTDLPSQNSCTSFSENNSNGGVCVTPCNDINACNYFEGSPNNDDCEYSSCGGPVGNGILFLSDGIVEFLPTSVDSTSTASVLLVNTVGAEQTISLTVTNAAFSITNDSITIGAQDTAQVVFVFTPFTTGTFVSAVTATGDIFGDATLALTGSATLADFSFSPDTLHLGTSPVNQTNQGSFSVTSIGDGPIALFSALSSSPEFSVPTGTITIEEGTTQNIPVTFFTEQNGNFSADITFQTTAPQSPDLTVHVTASAVTEISGDACGTWSLANSPYTLVGDVTVAAGCSLIVEAGVEILGQYDIIANSPVHFQGTESAPIYSESNTVQLLQADTASFAFTEFTSSGNLFSESFENASGTGSYNNNSLWSGGQYWTCLDSNSMSFYDVPVNYNGSGGCDYVYRQSSCHAFENSYYYDFRSTDYSGTLFSRDYFIGKSGEYNFSMTYVLDQADRNCEFLVGYQINSDSVIYEHRTFDQQNTYFQCNRSDRLASFPIEANAGDTVRIVLTNFIASEASDQDYIQVYFDALRLDYNRRADELVAELNWTDSTAFQSWSSSTGNGDSLLFATDEMGDRYLRFIVDYGANSVQATYTPSGSGIYFLEWEDRVPNQMPNKEPRVYTNSNGNNSQYQIHQHYDSYSLQEGQPYTEWRKHIVNLGYTTANNVIRVWFDNYNGNTGGDLEWH